VGVPAPHPASKSRPLSSSAVVSPSTRSRSLPSPARRSAYVYAISSYPDRTTSRWSIPPVSLVSLNVFCHNLCAL
jgi:hypothetical protein